MAHIKLDKKILEWEWYSNINVCRLWIHMLIKANWKDGRFMGEEIKRGSFVSSLPKLSDETSLTIQEIRTCLKHLKSTGELTVKTFSKYSVFTIENYCLYQDVNTQPNSQPTDNQHSIDSLSTTIEEVKELEEVKNKINYLTIIEMYNEICKSYPTVRKVSEDRKKAISARARQGYSVDDFKELFEIAENSKFLKGGNDNNWSANFDWLIKDKNMAKALDGNYSKENNKIQPKANNKPKNRFVNYEQRTDWDWDELEKLEREHIKQKLETNDA